MKTKIYQDLVHLPEDDRIAVLGQVAEQGQIAAFIVEDDDKADRYIQKLQERFKIQVLSRTPGRVGADQVVAVRIGPAALVN